MNIVIRGLPRPLYLYLDTLYSVIINSPSTDAAVVIDGQVYVLSPSGKSSIIFQAKAPSEKPYYYAKLKKGTKEIVERERFVRYPTARAWTFNEFYNRNWNAKKVLNFETVDGIAKSHNRRDDRDLHISGQIPTIHVQADPVSLISMHKQYLDDVTVTVNVTHISATKVKHFMNVEFGISGRTSRYFNKLPYKIKIPKDDYNLSGYRHLKLRSVANDPSYMREYITANMLHAVNQPTTRASYVRLFMNEQPIGLYLLVEKYDSTWLANEFDSKRNGQYKNGITYEGHGGRTERNRADFSFKGDDPRIFEESSFEIAEGPKEGNNDFGELVEFTRFVRDQQYLQRSTNAVAKARARYEWEKRLDVEGFLTNMAMEFLLGFADGYTENTNNFYLYKDPERGKFVYIPWDYDYTLGNGPFDMDAILVGDYMKFGRMTSLPLTSAILQVPEYRQLLEHHIDLIARNLLNTTTLFPIIDSLAAFIYDDVLWDQKLPRIGKGPSYITGGLHAFLEGKIDQDASLPFCTSFSVAADFLIRVNHHVDFRIAVEGRTGYKSLLGVKEWFKRKLTNYYNRVDYIPGVLRQLIHV
ncbi:coth-domain-containing protein [Rhizopus microsporus var. microsporus]|uniref:Coth-domain-containing protein n=1 Tax=Rhizopus microsporus var. microsporus TaxID=86635 RepID=A0A1X0R052_RHIZD|nr:coth-domain-containing protein [Rhizopus microsporus var. microsporus]